ncbi:hypothetical protein ACLB2K_071393 [Fragaria x ananassa]
MSAPPTLPITNPQTTSSSVSQSSVLRAFLSRFTSSIRSGFSQRRPWYELLDRSSLARPDSLTEAYSRIRKNFTYFRVNYVTLLTAVLALSLLTHPFSLLVLLSLLGAWAFLYLFRSSDQPLVIAGRTFTDAETLIGLVALTVVVVFFSSVGSLLISALLIGFGIVCAHGAFRVPEDLFLDDQEPANAGFLSFLGGAQAAATAAAARV